MALKLIFIENHKYAQIIYHYYAWSLHFGDYNCVRLWLHTHMRMQKEHKENSFDGHENTSTSGEFGEIWRCFQ